MKPVKKIVVTKKNVPAKPKVVSTVKPPKTPTKKISLITNTLKYPAAITPRQKAILNNVRAKNKNTRYA